MRADVDLILECDASVKGSVGSGAWAFVALDPDERVLYEDCGMIAKFPVNNNEAELIAMLEALKFAKDLGYVRNVELRSDSLTGIKHLRNHVMFNSPLLNAIGADVAEYVDWFDYVDLVHIPRRFNQHADRLSRVPFHNNRNRAMRHIIRDNLDTVPGDYLDESFWEENYDT